MTDSLNDVTLLERSILEVERLRWKYPAAKAAFVLEWTGLSETHYYQRLNELLDRPEAEVYDPATVRRLLRLRDARERARTGR